MKLAAAYERDIRKVTDAESEDFAELARLARLDPRRAFVGGNFANFDFGTSDLSGYNFSEANLTGADFSRAVVDNVRISGAILDGTIWPPGVSVGHSRITLRAPSHPLTARSLPLAPARAVALNETTVAFFYSEDLDSTIFAGRGTAIRNGILGAGDLRGIRVVGVRVPGDLLSLASDTAGDLVVVADVGLDGGFGIPTMGGAEELLEEVIKRAELLNPDRLVAVLPMRRRDQGDPLDYWMAVRRDPGFGSAITISAEFAYFPLPDPFRRPGSLERIEQVVATYCSALADKSFRAWLLDRKGKRRPLTLRVDAPAKIPKKAVVKRLVAEPRKEKFISFIVGQERDVAWIEKNLNRDWHMSRRSSREKPDPDWTLDASGGVGLISECEDIGRYDRAEAFAVFSRQLLKSWGWRQELNFFSPRDDERFFKPMPEGRHLFDRPEREPLQEIKLIALDERSGQWSMSVKANRRRAQTMQRLHYSEVESLDALSLGIYRRRDLDEFSPGVIQSNVGFAQTGIRLPRELVLSEPYETYYPQLAVPDSEADDSRYSRFKYVLMGRDIAAPAGRRFMREDMEQLDLFEREMTRITDLEQRLQSNKFRYYIAVAAVSSHRIFDLVPARIVPTASVVFFQSESIYMLGILMSRIHGIWANHILRPSSYGLRYSPRCFATFPLPAGEEPETRDFVSRSNPALSHRARIAEAARLILQFRANWLETYGRQNPRSSLNTLYRKPPQEFEGMRERLDQAVAEAYGFPDYLGEYEILENLREQNQQQIAL